MARTVYGDDVIFNAMENGRVPAAFHNYVNSQWGQLQGIASNAVSTIFSGVNHLVDRMNETDIYGLAEAAMNYVATLWGQDVFQPLDTLGRIQNAPDCMVPYLMAQPALRALHNAGRCQSYGNRYVDLSPGTIEHNHEEWRMVMNGVMNICPETADWEATTYYQLDDRYDAIDPLTHHQSMVIRDAWGIIAEAIDNKVDPSSQFGDDL